MSLSAVEGLEVGACHVGRRTACLLYDSRCMALPSSPHECLVLQSDKDKYPVSASFPLKRLWLVQVSDTGSAEPHVCVATRPSVSPTTKEELTDRGVAYNVIAVFPCPVFPGEQFPACDLGALFVLTGQGIAEWKKSFTLIEQEGKGEERRSWCDTSHGGF